MVNLVLFGSTTVATLLYGRAINASITAIHAAVALPWFEYIMAMCTLVKILTSPGRHRFFFLVTALGAGYNRL